MIYHHERPDGSGYPEGLTADDIPFSARIVRVADAFDSLTTDQPYRQAVSASDAVAHLIQGRGTSFDGDVVDALIALIRDDRLDVAA